MILNVNQTSRVTIIIHAPNKILESHQNHHSCQFLYPQNPPFLPFQGSMPSWRSRRSAERQKPPAWRKPLPMPSWVGRGGLLETSHESLGQQQEPCCFTPGEKKHIPFFHVFLHFYRLQPRKETRCRWSWAKHGENQMSKRLMLHAPISPNKVLPNGAPKPTKMAWAVSLDSFE